VIISTIHLCTKQRVFCYGPILGWDSRLTNLSIMIENARELGLRSELVADRTPSYSVAFLRGLSLPASLTLGLTFLPFRAPLPADKGE
jgi:hypothetical protein